MTPADARLTWTEVDARWPGASAMWDGTTGGEVEPNLVVAGATLWNLCRYRDTPCRCMAWSGARWIRWAELSPGPHPSESEEKRFAGVTKLSAATEVIEQLADLPEYAGWLEARDGLPRSHPLAWPAAEAFRDLGFNDAWCERIYDARKAAHATVPTGAA